MGVGFKKTSSKAITTLLMVSALCLPPAISATSEPEFRNDLKPIFELFSADRDSIHTAFLIVDGRWHDGYIPMLLEVLRFTRNSEVVARLVEVLQMKTGQGFGYDVDRWYQWLWNREEQRLPYYATFKSLLYGQIDPKFQAYFSEGRPARIRLDEIVWGGVVQDGIPPLRSPRMIAPDEARYLVDDNIVFGLVINGDARAYPKRILAWHEMFVDVVGGVPVTGAYCTLCGSMILYKSEANGILHQLGTSGFLYRSNKLMYDKDTQSLWNTLWGAPVLGPLVDENIQLERLSVVTTTWGEWRRRHPETSVLSLDTGHIRDYSEGEAYREYFATDELMFTVPGLDQRLRNKDEVIGLIFPQHPDKPLAIAADYLSKHPVFHDRVGEVGFVVLTDRSGANRVYETQDVTFASWDGEQSVIDENGDTWHLTESALSAPNGRQLYRLPAHRAFWFGWYSAYSHSRLVH
jgi:hypothetical protein